MKTGSFETGTPVALREEFLRLYRAQDAVLMRHALDLTDENIDRAESLFQGTFVEALDVLPHFLPGTNLRAFLTVIMEALAGDDAEYRWREVVVDPNRFRNLPGEPFDIVQHITGHQVDEMTKRRTVGEIRDQLN